MRKTGLKALDLEERLRQHYRDERGRAARINRADSVDAKQNLALLMANEATQARRTPFQPISHIRFVANQARFIRPATWATQVALLACVLLACLSDAATPSRLLLAASLFGAATAAIGLPGLARSKAQGLAELEYACRFNCTYVLAARLVIIGCANVAALACCCIAMPVIAHTSLPDVAARVCAPYFLTCAGALLITRRTRSDSALLLSALWGVGVVAAAYAALLVAPQLYDAASTWLWAVATAAAFAWTAREAYLLMCCATRGLDAFCPASHLKRSF